MTKAKWDYNNLDENGFPTLVVDEKAPDHVCDILGPVIEVDSWCGEVTTATCSVCGKHAFNNDIWD